jgi:hypothetical protein
MRKHGGNVDGNRRLFANWEAYHAGEVLDVAAAVPGSWKRGRKLFRRATRPFLERVKFVPHASDLRFPGLSHGVSLGLAPSLWLARSGRALFSGELHRRHRPWPRWSSVAGSPVLQAQWQTLTRNKSPLWQLFTTTDIQHIDGMTRRWYSLRRLMLMQLTYLTSLAG